MSALNSKTQYQVEEQIDQMMRAGCRISDIRLLLPSSSVTPLRKMEKYEFRSSWGTINVILDDDLPVGFWRTEEKK